MITITNLKGSGKLKELLENTLSNNNFIVANVSDDYGIAWIRKNEDDTTGSIFISINDRDIQYKEVEIKLWNKGLFTNCYRYITDNKIEDGSFQKELVGSINMFLNLIK